MFHTIALNREKNLSTRLATKFLSKKHLNHSRLQTYFLFFIFKIIFDFQTPIFLAVQAGNIALTSWLIKNGADPNIQGTVSY